MPAAYPPDFFTHKLTGKGYGNDEYFTGRIKQLRIFKGVVDHTV